MVGGHLNLGDLIAWNMLQLGVSQGALSLKNGFELGPVNDCGISKEVS
jgi:hypothetical protein